MYKGISLIIKNGENDYLEKFEMEISRALLLSIYNRYAQYEKILSNPSWENELPSFKELLFREYGEPSELDVFFRMLSNYDCSETQLDVIIEMTLNHIKKKKVLQFNQSWFSSNEDVNDLWKKNGDSINSTLLNIQSNSHNFYLISQSLHLMVCLFMKEVSDQIQRIKLISIQAKLTQPYTYEDFFTYMMKNKIKQVLKASKKALIHNHKKYLSQSAKNVLDVF